MNAWKVIDGIVNGATLTILYSMFGRKAALIGFFLIFWNFIDGIIRFKPKGGKSKC